MKRIGAVVTVLMAVAWWSGAPPAEASVDPSANPGYTLTGYWLSQPDGTVSSVGNAPSLGDASGFLPVAPIVGISAVPGRRGFWQVGADGGMFSFGDAQFYGSTGAIRLNQPVVGMAATPDGGGYWLVAADGGVFSFGDAQFYGSTGAIRLNQPVVGMAATPDGGGYWLVAADGGVFGFGDAHFYGSTGSVRLAAPVDSIAATPDGGGYWLSAVDGGVFAFGDGGFYGSATGFAGGTFGITATPDGHGYWLPLRYGGNDPAYARGVYPAGDATAAPELPPPAALPAGSQLAVFATAAYPQLPACGAAGLTATLGSAFGAVGHGASIFVLTNHTSATCSLTGYPGYQMTAGGQPVPLTVSDQLSNGFIEAYVPPEVVDLAPGGTASFSLEYLNRQDLRPADASTITLPGSGGQLTVPGGIGTPDDAYATVSAIAPGPFAGGQAP